ncbi:MAG: hypothetical protein ACOCZ8_03155 [Bacteroidota bacterium]
MEQRYKNFDAETEQLIDSYLRRELHGPKRKAFEERLQNEPDLVEELYLRKDIAVGIQVAEQKAFRKMLISYESEVGLDMAAEDKKNSLYNVRVLIITVIIAALIVAALGISVAMGWL